MVLSSKKFFKHCPVCGSRLNLKSGKHSHPTCRQCGFVFYQNSKPCVGAMLINSKGEVLLVKRGVKPFFGYWDVPGGFMEEGEDPVVGLKRELHEELGVRLKKIKLFGLYPDTYADQYLLPIINIMYTAEIASGKLTPQDDITSYQWFPKKEIPWKRLSFKWLPLALKDFIKQ